MNNEITFSEAKRLSLKHWDAIIANNGVKLPLDQLDPEIRNLTNQCGFCEKYMNLKSDDDMKPCETCPLAKGYDLMQVPGAVCGMDDHQYLVWFENQTAENALVVRDMIENSVDPEGIKYFIIRQEYHDGEHRYVCWHTDKRMGASVDEVEDNYSGEAYPNDYREVEAQAAEISEDQYNMLQRLGII